MTLVYASPEWLLADDLAITRDGPVTGVHKVHPSPVSNQGYHPYVAMAGCGYAYYEWYQRAREVGIYEAFGLMERDEELFVYFPRVEGGLDVYHYQNQSFAVKSIDQRVYAAGGSYIRPHWMGKEPERRPWRGVFQHSRKLGALIGNVAFGYNLKKGKFVEFTY